MLVLCMGQVWGMVLVRRVWVRGVLVSGERQGFLLGVGVLGVLAVTEWSVFLA